MIKIILYEDQANLRQALAGLIESVPDFKLLGAYEHCSNVLIDIATHMPDVIILDINMPIVNGLEGLKIFKPLYPNIDVLILTMYDDDETVFEAMRNGASGYLLKSSLPTKIIEAIKDIKAGGAPISAMVARKVLDALPGKIKFSEDSSTILSDREKEVLELLAKGFSQKMVAAKLNVSINTIKTLIKRCYQKLNVHSITEALAKLYYEK
jgi:DNA-binding NarL/FixJ family response regulator